MDIMHTFGNAPPVDSLMSTAFSKLGSSSQSLNFYPF